MRNKAYLGGAMGGFIASALIFISVYHLTGHQGALDDPCQRKDKIPTCVYDIFCKSTRSTPQLPLQDHIDRVLEQENVIPIVVLGSGPAGLSAALYGSRAKIRTLVIAGDRPGGQLMETTHIENWPGKKRVLASDAIDELRSQAQSFGAEFLQGTIEKVDFTNWPYRLWTDTGKEINALAVVISTGASPRRLNIPGEQKFWGSGVTACAICDAPFYKNKDVVVIGGGDSAVEEASILSSYAKNVTVLVRKGKMRAAVSMQKRLEKLPNVTVLYHREPREILGSDDGVSGVNVYHAETKSIEQLSVDGVFLAIGHEPNTSLFAPPLELTKKGFISVLGRTQQTSLPGVFAAGDVADEKYRQAGKAAGDGIAAALDAIDFLHNIGYTQELSHRLTRSTALLFEGEEALVNEVDSLSDFKQEVLSSKDVVALLAESQTCPSCPEARRAFDLTSHRFEGRVKFYAVDVDEQKEIEEDELVRARKTPCLLLYKEGKLLSRQYDFGDKFNLYNYIDEIRDAVVTTN